MTPIWNDEIERIKQDPDASVFLVSFASQAEAKSTIHKLSFARQVTKEGKTGLALPGHVNFKVGKSPEGTIWVLLTGRMSTDESLEAYEVFGIYGGEQTIVIPSQVQSRIIGMGVAPTEFASVQAPAKVATKATSSEIKEAQEPVVAKPVPEPAEIKFTPFVAAPAQRPVEVASIQTPAEVTKAQESTVVAPAPAPAKVTPATAPIVVKAPPTSAEIKPVPVVVATAKPSLKIATVPELDQVGSVPETTRVSPVQKPVVPKPAPEPVVVQASQSPAEIRPAPVVVKAAPEPAQVESPPSPDKVTPTPAVNASASSKEAKPASTPTTPPSNAQSTTRIYLVKEGNRQGPFTLEHINAEITAKRYKDDDFWAWHDGLPEWIPLYKVAGVCKPAKT